MNGFLATLGEGVLTDCPKSKAMVKYVELSIVMRWNVYGGVD